MRVYVGVLLTLVTLAMNVGYKWSLHDMVPRDELGALKWVATAALVPLIFFGPSVLRSFRQVGSDERKN